MESPDNPSPETQEKWKKEPNNWIWGIFYFNKEDKRLFVSKKVEWMGTTLNFANPKSSALFMIGFLLFFGFILLMMVKKNQLIP